jgi:hypothetical protein
VAALLLLGGIAAAGDLYTCTTPGGQRISRDRLIVECATVDQLVHRGDGRVERIAPALSDDELARLQAEKVRIEAERQRKIKEDRADRLLVSRFPNQAAHDKARQEALDGASTAIRIAEQRILLLEAERKKLADEAEFYPGGRPMPPKLKSDIDRNDAALKAQRALLLNQQGEAKRIKRPVRHRARQTQEALEDQLARRLLHSRRARPIWPGALRRSADSRRAGAAYLSGIAS